tara:strand:+ start:4696 stop:5238 length:543 start_codon:yes stop_codon:yes gene_type:complete
MATLFVDKVDPQSGTSLELGTSGDTVSIGSGVTQTIAVNTPSFQATVNAAQTIATGTATKINFNTENFDTDGTYDVSSYRFTPAVAGKYLIHGRIGWADEPVEDKSQETRIFKNGSLVFQANRRTAASTGRDATVACIAIVDLGASDYVEIFGYHNSGSDADTLNSTTACLFEGYKLIGV